MAFLTFLTTVRGRLAHLKQTLPTFVAQPDSAVIVVDYRCPDGTADWVEANHPSVEVIREREASRFEISRARNLGVAAVRTPWICFVDADVALAPDFSEKVCPLLTAGRYYQARPRTIETWGTVIIAWEDIDRVGGYDEVIQGWGKEDDDLYARLVISGVKRATFPGETLRGISHEDAARVAHYDIKDRWLSESVNHVYCRVKIDLESAQHGPLDVASRRRIYDTVRAAILRGHESGQAISLSFPFIEEDTRACGPIQGELRYTLPAPKGKGEPSRTAASVIPKRLRG